MSSYNYVDNVNSNLICCVCRAPFLNPTVTTTCSHTFCRDCIVRSLELQACCPVDRSPLTLGDLKPENLLLRNMVDELIVECPYKPSGCKHTCQRQLLGAHLRDSCQYVQVACSEEGCGKAVLRKDLGRHTHDCAHRAITCEACGATLKACDLQSHYLECVAKDIACSACSESMLPSELDQHKSRCAEAEVACAHSGNGCTWMGPRKSADSHLSRCPYEAIKGFFSVNESRMASLHDENSTLRQKLNTAESTVHSLRHDLDVARKALGPWWRTDSTALQAQARQVEPSVSADVPVSQPPHILPLNGDQTRWRTPNPLSPILTFSADSPVSSTHELDSAFAASPTSPYSNTVDPAFLAHYFPPASGPDQSDTTTVSLTGGPSPAQPDAFVRHVFPFSSRGAFPPPIRFPDTPSQNPRQASQSSIIRVPPVNYSSGLEGALTGIRNSVVALSTSLDALERRQNIALTTENLRMNEEVGALRAIVHGLRMQVHSLIMERNGHAWVPTTTTTTQYFNQSPPTTQPMIINSTTSTTKL